MSVTGLKLDARAGLFLLIILNFAIFNVSSADAIGVMLIWNAAYAVWNGFYATTLKFGLAYLLLTLTFSYALPNLPGIVAVSTAVLLTYAVKMLPLALFGYVFVKTTGLNELIATLRQIRFPEEVITALSITLRYFPALKEDYSLTRDAMKLRSMSLPEKIAGLIITTITRASLTIEELSQAATVRGIDNPGRKSSMTKVQFKISDAVICVASAVFYTFVCRKY